MAPESPHKFGISINGARSLGVTAFPVRCFFRSLNALFGKSAFSASNSFYITRQFCRGKGNFGRQLPCHIVGFSAQPNHPPSRVARLIASDSSREITSLEANRKAATDLDQLNWLN